MKNQITHQTHFETGNPIISKLLNLFYLSTTKTSSKISNEKLFNWFPNFYYKNPINLLFSNDQFLYEFLLKYPQRRKASEFKLQLKEQKKLSLFYSSLSKKQLQKYFILSNSSQGEFSKNFINLLERRLDVILYRAQFVKTIAAARQLIIHKKVLVNQKTISIPSYLANPGDIISIPSYNNLKISQALENTLKLQKLSSENSILSLQDWKFKNKFLSKTQLRIFISLLIKKICYRAEIESYSNPFLNIDKNTQYSKFQIYKAHQISLSLKLNSETFRKILLQTLSNFNFNELSKEIFFLQVKNKLSKNNSKNILLYNLNNFGTKPIHLETSYKIFTTIFLYSPQRLYYPFTLDFDLLSRAQLKF